MAVAMLRAGLCVLPARPDSKRPALASWKEFQHRLPTEDEVRAWFDSEAAMCVVTGAVSGHLEMLDFDAGGEAFDAWAELVRDEAPGLLDRLVIERSPSGGRHVPERCLRQPQDPRAPGRRARWRPDDTARQDVHTAPRRRPVRGVADAHRDARRGRLIPLPSHRRVRSASSREWNTTATFAPRRPRSGRKGSVATRSALPLSMRRDR